MLNNEFLSLLFKKTLSFLEKNPNATISARWQEGNRSLYVNSEGKTFWVEVKKDTPQIVWQKDLECWTQHSGELMKEIFRNHLKIMIAEYFSRRGYPYYDILKNLNS